MQKVKFSVLLADKKRKSNDCFKWARSGKRAVIQTGEWSKRMYRHWTLCSLVCMSGILHHSAGHVLTTAESSFLLLQSAQRSSLLHHWFLPRWKQDLWGQHSALGSHSWSPHQQPHISPCFALIPSLCLIPHIPWLSGRAISLILLLSTRCLYHFSIPISLPEFCTQLPKCKAVTPFPEPVPGPSETMGNVRHRGSFISAHGPWWDQPLLSVTTAQHQPSHEMCRMASWLHTGKFLQWKIKLFRSLKWATIRMMRIVTQYWWGLRDVKDSLGRCWWEQKTWEL